MNPEYTRYREDSLINQYEDYTSTDLRKIADHMDSSEIISFEMECFAEEIECVAKRLATPKEIEKNRLDREAYLASTRERELKTLKELQEKYK